MKAVMEVDARVMTASRKSTSVVSVARSAIEKAEELGIFKMAERCTRVLVESTT